MKKYEPLKKDLSADIDVRRLGDEPVSFTLTATPDQLAEIAALHDIPALHCLDVTGIIEPGEPIAVRGTLTADMDRTCVVTGETIPERMTAPFVLLFSETPETADPKEIDIDLEGEPIEAIRHHHLFLKEALIEQFGLNLNPFPKKTTEPFIYRDSADQPDESPFAVLKNLTSR